MLMSKCCTCGYEWQTGLTGNHSCSKYLKIEIERLKKLSEWISVDDHLPEDNVSFKDKVRVLIWVADKTMPGEEIASRFEFQGQMIWNCPYATRNWDTYQNEITHWKYLPGEPNNEFPVIKSENRSELL